MSRQRLGQELPSLQRPSPLLQEHPCSHAFLSPYAWRRGTWGICVSVPFHPMGTSPAQRPSGEWAVSGMQLPGSNPMTASVECPPTYVDYESLTMGFLIWLKPGRRPFHTSLQQIRFRWFSGSHTGEKPEVKPSSQHTSDALQVLCIQNSPLWEGTEAQWMGSYVG